MNLTRTHYCDFFHFEIRLCWKVVHDFGLIFDRLSQVSQAFFPVPARGKTPGLAPERWKTCSSSFSKKKRNGLSRTPMGEIRAANSNAIRTSQERHVSHTSHDDGQRRLRDGHTLTYARRKRKKKSQTFREKHVEKNRTRHESDSPQGDRDERRANPETMDASCCHQGAAHLPLEGKGPFLCERRSWSTVWKLQNFLPITRRVWQQLRKKWRTRWSNVSIKSSATAEWPVVWSLKGVSNTFRPLPLWKKKTATQGDARKDRTSSVKHVSSVTFQAQSRK